MGFVSSLLSVSCGKRCCMTVVEGAQASRSDLLQPPMQKCEMVTCPAALVLTICAFSIVACMPFEGFYAVYTYPGSPRPSKPRNYRSGVPLSLAPGRGSRSRDTLPSVDIQALAVAPSTGGRIGFY